MSTMTFCDKKHNTSFTVHYAITQLERNEIFNMIIVGEDGETIGHDYMFMSYPDIQLCGSLKEQDKSAMMSCIRWGIQKIFSGKSPDEKRADEKSQRKRVNIYGRPLWRPKRR